MVKIAGICGSLRAASYNRGLLRVAAVSVPDGASMEVVEIGDLPLFNEDLEKPSWPEPVMAFRRALWRADAILFVTPEYNAGMPGVLKNAVDWASRPHRSSPLDCKPVALLGATAGRGSTLQAQAQLREALVYTGSCTLSQPEFSLTRASTAFDAAGRLIEDDAREALRELLDTFAQWVRVIRTGEGNRYQAQHVRLTPAEERMPRAS